MRRRLGCAQLRAGGGLGHGVTRTVPRSHPHCAGGGLCHGVTYTVPISPACRASCNLASAGVDAEAAGPWRPVWVELPGPAWDGNARALPPPPQLPGARGKARFWARFWLSESAAGLGRRPRRQASPRLRGLSRRSRCWFSRFPVAAWGLWPGPRCARGQRPHFLCGLRGRVHATWASRLPRAHPQLTSGAGGAAPRIVSRHVFPSSTSWLKYLVLYQSASPGTAVK